jgi:uncharacterized protein YaaW (UPF0174 family)
MYQQLLEVQGDCADTTAVLLKYYQTLYNNIPFDVKNHFLLKGDDASKKTECNKDIKKDPLGSDGDAAIKDVRAEYVKMNNNLKRKINII